MSSFQHDVKEELYLLELKSECCVLSEYSAIRLTSKKRIRTKSRSYADRLKFFIKKVHGAECDISNRDDEYIINLPPFSYEFRSMNECCMRSFIRGIYITSGRINNLDKPTHMEISSIDDFSYKLCLSIFSHFNIDVKTADRYDKKLIYIKRAEDVSDFLTLIGAHIAVCTFENSRIIKEIRNNTNRAVNCDNANIQKANDAAYRQIEAINHLLEKNMLDTLPENLKETAFVRLENPDLDLKELGKLLNPPISKAGTAHRLKKLIELASDE